MYLVRDDYNGVQISKHVSFQFAVDRANKYLENYSDSEGYSKVTIYTLSHTVEQKPERVPVMWEERTTLDVQEVKPGG